MRRQSLIFRQLKPKARARFNQLMDDQGKTIDELFIWLRHRGIKTSRSAVARCRKNRSARARVLASSAAGLRRQIQDIAGRLPFDDLYALTFYARFISSGL